VQRHFAVDPAAATAWNGLPAGSGRVAAAGAAVLVGVLAVGYLVLPSSGTATTHRLAGSRTGGHDHGDVAGERPTTGTGGAHHGNAEIFRSTSGDALVRLLQDLIATVADLRRRGGGFTYLHESLDTTTPGGRLVFHVFAALAEFIRELIVAGTREGLAAARARGRVGGRPTVVTPEIPPRRPRPAAQPRRQRHRHRPLPRRQPGHPLQPHPRPARATRRLQLTTKIAA
jgi:hypothetical protein